MVNEFKIDKTKIRFFESEQTKKQKSKEHGTKQKGYVAGAKTVNDDAKFIVTRISPIADLKEIKEYCGVCFDGESYEEDPIIFCEGCDVAVHLACYGLQKVPEGDWMCRACSTRSSKTVKPLELGTRGADDVFKRVCRGMISNQWIGTDREYVFDWH